MKQAVMIKGTKSGIIVALDPDMDFEQLKEKTAAKFREASSFLGDAAMALGFEGRKLSNEEQAELLDVISENSRLKIMCLVETDASKEELLHKSLEERLMSLNTNTGQFYKGNLRSGQVVEFDTSIIIIGDVNSGARVVSRGNVVILGSLKGNVFAGAGGNLNAFVVALDMRPIQIRIADIIARAPDKPAKKSAREAKIAFAEEGNIYIEPLNKDVLNDINI